MINLQRPPTPPASLATRAVRDYIDACAAAKAAGGPKPESSASYRGTDVLTVFTEDFHSKCYLTEQWFANAYAMDVDHFVPVNEDPARKYEWRNLLPAEHRANMMRPDATPVGGLLNPCEATDDVEQRLTATLDWGGDPPHFAAVDPADIKAANTAELLNYLHNGRPDKPDSVHATATLRLLIRQRYDQVMKAIQRFLYATAHRQKEPQQYANARRQLQYLLSRRAPFTQLMRGLESVHLYVPRELLD